MPLALTASFYGVANACLYQSLSIGPRFRPVRSWSPAQRSLWRVGAVWVIGGKIATDATTSQDVNLRVAVATLERAIPGLEARYGREGDITRLEAPSLPDFDSHEIIDSVGRQTGETSTVFIWDDSQRDFVRRTTNITRPDGSRAVGTVLGAGPVYDAMMAGQSFRGEAVILGTLTTPLTSRSSPPAAMSSASFMSALSAPKSSPCATRSSP
jgi:hypothetical protein